MCFCVALKGIPVDGPAHTSGRSDSQFELGTETLCFCVALTNEGRMVWPFWADGPPPISESWTETWRL